MLALKRELENIYDHELVYLFYRNSADQHVTDRAEFKNINVRKTRCVLHDTSTPLKITFCLLNKFFLNKINTL